MKWSDGDNYGDDDDETANAATGYDADEDYHDYNHNHDNHNCTISWHLSYIHIVMQDLGHTKQELWFSYYKNTLDETTIFLFKGDRKKLSNERHYAVYTANKRVIMRMNS